ncbi:hypothetical protein [Streptomyces rimosus]|uniref:hypothetical protein n=1 Tax=Streptomyces rimosus TaxID=1927 RepID=UPI0037D9820B
MARTAYAPTTCPPRTPPGQAAVTYGFLFDGSLRLRYGALLDIRIPADRIASVRLDRQFPSGKLAAMNENASPTWP